MVPWVVITLPMQHSSRGAATLISRRSRLLCPQALKPFSPAATPRHDPRQQLERLLPLTPAEGSVREPCSSSSSSSAPSGADLQPASPECAPSCPDTVSPLLPAAAAEAVVLDSSSSHQSEGTLTVLFNRALAKLGIQITDRARGLICLNVLVLLWASNWVVIKDSEAYFDPYAFSFLRFAVAAAAFSPFLKAASADKRVVTGGIELGLWTAAGYLLQSQGLLTTDASRASFLSTFTVIVVPILAGLSGRGVQPLTWFSAVAALIGMSLLEGGGAPPCVGDVWSFLSAIAFGVQVFRTEHWARTLGARRAVPLMSVVLAVTMACSLAAAVIAHPDTTLQLLGHPGLVQTALTEGQFPWQAVLWTGLLTTDVCLLMELTALREVSSSEAAIIYALEPVLGAFFAYMLLGERWGPLGWAGAGLIVASSLVTQLYGKEEGEPVLESISEHEDCGLSEHKG